MCIAAISIQSNHTYPVIILMNRDEFYNRPTLPLSHWEENQIVGGQDLVSKGTWAGVSQNKKYGMLTNFRNFHENKSDALSRGIIIPNYLNSNLSPLDFLKLLQSEAHQYKGFNLILGDDKSTYYYSNQTHKIEKMKDGIYVLSNALLDTPWPKVEKLRKKFTEVFHNQNNELFTKKTDGELNKEFLNLMLDTETFPEVDLPNTGAGIELEKLLSPIFIKFPSYGTRSTSLIKIEKSTGSIEFIERTFMEDGVNAEKQLKMNQN